MTATAMAMATLGPSDTAGAAQNVQPPQTTSQTRQARSQRLAAQRQQRSQRTLHRVINRASPGTPMSMSNLTNAINEVTRQGGTTGPATSAALRTSGYVQRRARMRRRPTQNTEGSSGPGTHEVTRVPTDLSDRSATSAPQPQPPSRRGHLANGVERLPRGGGSGASGCSPNANINDDNRSASGGGRGSRT